jgi:hypothetical protein
VIFVAQEIDVCLTRAIGVQSQASEYLIRIGKGERKGVLVMFKVLCFLY